MPGPFLRRWLAALLLFASPAISGQLAPLLHPCTAIESGVAGHHGGHAGHGDPGATTEDSETGHEICTCLGACNTAAADTAVPLATIAPQHVPAPRVAPRVVRSDAWLVVDRPLDLLPPPTAPPLT